MRHLGVDPGERRVGLATSDDDGRMAFPLRTVVRTSDAQAARDVAEAAREQGARAIVVGLPLGLDGKEGAAARRARGLGEEIARLVDVPVVYWDERLTSAAAERSLDLLGVRGKRRRQVVDASAAALILSAYLESKTGAQWHEDQNEGRAPDDRGGPGFGRRKG